LRGSAQREEPVCQGAARYDLLVATSKAHILEELRRYAANNRGKAPGFRKFCTETGIKESDWAGKYWARWNDALREAGLDENEKETGYEDVFLIEKLVELCTEHGHFPTLREFKLKASTVEGFPSDNVFRRRYGSKADMARAVRAHCELNGPKTLLPICDVVLAEASTEARTKHGDQPTEGFVYLIRSGKHFKIGRTNSLERRGRELAIQLPERAELVHSIKTDDPVGIEDYWHRRFDDRRLNGEWFKLSADDVAAFRRRRFM
jgi:hypothetical protein